MSTREILTLQFGHYSNFIGTHFWNIQELSFDYTGTKETECNHDILYREGQTSKGEVTYTPRLLLADLKGALKTLPGNGGLTSDSQIPEDVIWDNIEKIEEPPQEKNEYLKDIESDSPADKTKHYDFDHKVDTWSDYLYPRFHSRTVNIINEYQHQDEHNSFDIYNIGSALWKSSYGDDFSDQIRKYVEECDSMQGFHINFDSTDAFAGLGMGCIEHLADEYGKTIMAYPIIASHFSDNKPETQEQRDKSNILDSARLINFFLSVEGLTQHCNMFAPLCTSDKGWRKPGNPRNFDFVTYKPELYYHSSALLASAFDTLSLRYRLKGCSYTLSDMCADITGYGRKMTAATLGIPFTFNESKYLIEHLNEVTKPLYSCITPSCKIGTDKIFQLITVRGIPESYLKANLKEAKAQMNIPAYRCNNVKEMFELYFQANNFLSATNVLVSEKPMETKTPFPKMFSQNLGKYGFIKNTDGSEIVESVPVISGLHNGKFMSDTLEKLHREVTRIKFSKLHKFEEAGLEELEFKEAADRLAEFKDNYDDDFEL